MQRAEVTDEVWAGAARAARAAAAARPRPRWSAAARAAWALYAPLAADGRGAPYLFAQVGQSLDGRIATPSGDATAISGPEGLRHLHRCRALADAVVVGVRTALSDDPRLTVRLVEGPSPARVVIDPRGRLPRRRAGARRRRRPAAGGAGLRPRRGRTASRWCACPPPTAGSTRRRSATRSRRAASLRVLVEGGGVTIARLPRRRPAAAAACRRSRP